MILFIALPFGEVWSCETDWSKILDRPDIDSEPEIEARFWIPQIEHHATAVGYICVIYSKIEFYVDRLTSLVMGVPGEVGRAIATSSGQLERRILEIEYRLWKQLGVLPKSGAQ